MILAAENPQQKQLQELQEKKNSIFFFIFLQSNRLAASQVQFWNF